MRKQRWLVCLMTAASLREMRPGLPRNRLRDGRMRLPVGARLATTGCQVSGTMHRQRETHTGCELAEILMANKRESTENPVTIPEAKCGDTPCQKGKAGRRWYSHLTISPFDVPPGECGCLKGSQNVSHVEHGKPVHSHEESVVCLTQGGWKEEQAREPRRSE
jgi:hypothetical protein